MNTATFIDICNWRARHQPHGLAYRYLSKGETESDRLTYGELDHKARVVAGLLVSNGMTNERAVLVYPPGLEFIVAFFGCLYAGTIAVPSPLPRPRRGGSRFTSIVADAKAKLILTHSKIMETMRADMAAQPALNHVDCLATDKIDHHPLSHAAVDKETIAFLQYTSGSTRSPRGVVITHANLLHNSRSMRGSFEYTASSVCVSWLPVYHDMGLIGGVLQPMFGGFRSTLMSPASFLEKPVRWLRAISLERATISGAPNFAYDICSSKISPEEMNGLDLSCWEVAFNGSEPLKARTLETFVSAFAEHGFRRQAFFPCYGLAEATLMVSGGKKGQGPSILHVSKTALNQNEVIEVAPTDNDAKPIVGSGRILHRQQVLIVNPDSLESCPPDHVGEICISGESIARGYWDRREETEYTFHAQVPGTDGQHYLRTGDLGFVSNGTLFVTGRLKDMMIIRGNNHWPQDIESTAQESHASLKVASGAAFTIEAEEEERLIIAHEVRNHKQCDIDAVARTIRQAVAAEHGIQVYGIILVKPGGIPKTSSGKIQRWRCRDEFLAGRLPVVDSSILQQSDSSHDTSPVTRESILTLEPQERKKQIITYLQHQLAELLNRDQYTLHLELPLTALGLDSLLGMALCGRIEKSLQVEIPVSNLFAGLTIRELADCIMSQLAVTAIDEMQVISHADQGAPIPLSFEQERLWWLTQLGPGNSSYVIGASIRIQGRLNIPALQQSLDEIVRRHEILRTGFDLVDGALAQLITPARLGPVPVIDLLSIPTAERTHALLHLIAEERRRPIDLKRAPLLRLKLIKLYQDDHILTLVMHHIIADAWSLTVFNHELFTLYSARLQGLDSPLPELAFQYADFVRWQRQVFTSKKEHLIEYWTRQLAGAGGCRIPTDRPRPAARTLRRAHVYAEISEELVAAAQELGRGQSATLFMMLLAAFKIVLRHYSGQPDVIVGVPVAGRIRPEFESLIGMFAYPLMLRSNLSGNLTFRDILDRVRLETLAAYDHQELPFAESVRVSRPERHTGGAPLAQVVFSFVQTTPLSAAFDGVQFSEFSIDWVNPDFELFITLFRQPAGIKAQFEYDVDLFESKTIEQLAAAYLKTLENCLTSIETRLSDCAFISRSAVAIGDEALGPDTVAVAATFTSEPIRQVLDFWAQELDSPFQVAFAPYGQVFQELLTPGSLLSRNREGINVVLLKLDDLRQVRPTGDFGSEFEAIIPELVAALKASCGRTGVPHIVCLCPPTPANQDNLQLKRMEQFLAQEINDVPGLSLISRDQLLSTYPVSAYYDRHGDKLGHIPYLPEFFAGLGTMVARSIYALRNIPPKVLVLDCDQTLWTGVCAENGKSGITIDTGRKALQNFLLAQYRAGLLLCLCSKNEESDVFEVLDEHPDMLLRRNHLVAWRINWKPKSENIKSLADELSLPLNSFVFIDDNPVECLQVAAQYPELKVLQLPSNTDAIPEFLRHVWAFDHRAVTAEDKSRTDFYRNERQRQRLKAELSTLESFLHNLQLDIQINPMDLDQVHRVSQLTQRVNQFNTTTERRPPSEVEALYRSGTINLLTVEVNDRFGCYGLVGVVMFQATVTAIMVDTFLLSCRILGRRVEHNVMRHLREIAIRHGLDRVDVRFIPTKRNQPALDFLNSIDEDCCHITSEGRIFRFPLDRLSGLSLTDRAFGADLTEVPELRPEFIRGGAGGDSVGRDWSLRMLRLTSELRTAEQILKALAENRSGSKPDKAEDSDPKERPQSATQRKLMQIWKELLGPNPIGINDDFFKAGGHSLLAAQVLSRVNQAFGIELPLSVFFDETPTLSNLARVIEIEQLRQAEPGAVAEILYDLQDLTDDEVRILIASDLEQPSWPIN